MLNLHTHSLLSDGVLLPSEIAIRYKAAGYKAIAITDHADYSNIDWVVKSIVAFCNKWPKDIGISVLPGVELTHLPPEQFKPLAKFARSEGAKVIIAHGETLVEPVIPGTNKAALQADIDILAHPGLITDQDCELAAERNIFLEITTRKGHNIGNAHVVAQARKFKNRLIINHDSHTPEDIISQDSTIKIARKAGLSLEEINEIYRYAGKFLKLKEEK